MDNLVEVTLSRLMISETDQTHFVLLREVEGSRFLTIWIGAGEAMAIERKINEFEFSRPLTHDLLANVIHETGIGLESVEIDAFESLHEGQGGTYKAKLVLTKPDGETLRVDARPSDAIALGVRTEAPFFVAEDIMENQGQKDPAGDQNHTI